jgi:uncharacterized protein (DUF2236 family)
MIAARVNAERLVLLAWSRAILLQLAHPLVAAGVAEHSSFRDGGVAAALRLRHTVRAMLSLTFGTPQAREAALARIQAIHRRVNGRLGEAAGPFPAGTPYSAEDPALVRWVHLTLLESVPLVYDLLVAPLADADRDAYCAAAAPVARALGAIDVPLSWREVTAGISAMYDSGGVTVGRQARELASAVLAPPFAPIVAPIAHVNRLFAIGFLPPGLRAQYGFAWRERDERALARWVRILRGARRVTPDVLALWPEARSADRSTGSASREGMPGKRAASL